MPGAPRGNPPASAARVPPPSRGGTAPSATFDGFISYSHAVDGRLAPALQLGLHRFAKPWYRLRALRVFRDETSLSATPELWPSIVEALDASRWFILLASPEAARSKWVDDEAAHWCATKSTRQIIVVVTKDDHEGDFEWQRTASVPPSLRGALEHEPRVVDLRWAREDADVSLQNARFRDAVADVAAPLHGRPKDELHGEDVRQHRRTRRYARGAVAALTALLVVALAAAVVALDQREEARAQARVSLSRQLAAQSVNATRDGDLDLARLLALESYRVEPTADARSSLVTALQASPRAAATLVGHVGGFVKGVSFGPGGGTLASAGSDGSIRLWDTAAGRALGPPLVPVSKAMKDLLAGVATEQVPQLMMGVALSDDGRTLVAGRSDGLIQLFDVRTRTSRATIRDRPGLIGVALSPDGETLASAVEGRGIRLWDLARLRPLPSPPGTVAAGGSDFEGPLPALIAFSPDGTKLGWEGAREGINVWDLVRGRLVGRVPLESALLRVSGGLGFLDGRTLAVAGEDGVELWDLERLTRRDRLGQGQVFELSVSRDGRVLAASTEAGILVWDTRARRVLARLPATEERRPVLSRDGSMLATIDAQAIRLWQLTRATSLARPLQARVLSNVAFHPSASTMAAISLDGTIAWDLERSRARPLKAGKPRYADPAANAVVFAPSGRQLLVSNGGVVRLLDAAERSPRGRPIRHEGVKLAFAEDGRALALVRAGTGRLTLWDVGRGASVATIPIRTGHFGLAPNARSLAAGDVYKLEVWDIEQRRRLRSRPRGEYQPQDPVFSPDGSLIADSGVGGLFIYTARDLGLRAQLPSSGAAKAFSADGQTLAVTSGVGRIRLWDMAEGRALGNELRGPGAIPVSLSYGPSGTLAAVDESGRVLLWDELLASTSLESWRKRLCSVTARNLAPAEWAQFLPGQVPRRTCSSLTG